MDSPAGTVFLGVANFRDVLRAGFEILAAKNYSFIENTDPELESPIGVGADLSDVTVGIAGLERWDGLAMDSMPKLRAIIKAGTGVDNIDLQAARERSITVCNTPGLNSNAVAEVAVGLMIASMRNFEASRRSLLDEYSGSLVGAELTGKTVGLIGFGNIARRVAKLLSGFDVRTLFYDPWSPFDDSVLASQVDLDALLASSDVISLHLPATPQTEQIINGDSLAKFKRGAFLINTSRGSLVDEDAAMIALADGVLRGIGVDVYAEEPPRHDSAFLLSPLVVTTNHIGAATEEADHKVALALANRVLEVMEGREVQDTL